MSPCSEQGERKDTPVKDDGPVGTTSQGEESVTSALEEILREGARKLLVAALQSEIDAYVERFKEHKDEKGRCAVVKNGKSRERTILTGIGPLRISQPRVNDKREGESFTSAILPRYMRRVPSLDNLIPTLYLKGISTGDFTEALEAILGENAKGLSANTIVRLKRQWEQEYREWAKRDLTGKRYVYFWADGIYFNVRLEDAENKRQCFLIVIGALADGTKELVAVLDGYRESKLSWMEALSSLKERGLTEGPKLAIGDGGLGFWAALREIYPGCEEQRCWVHKTANVLDKMPKSVQPKAKEKIHDIYLAPTKEQALVAYNSFFSLYGKKFPEACECLAKDKEVLFTFYDYPAEHWIHVRTTNPIESTFATVRLRTEKTKGCGTRLATLTMVFKLVLETKKTWKKIKGYRLIPKVLDGVTFVDGELPDEEEQVA